ncbi:MAG: hypothetical protein ACKO37_09250 [Vampirovibrionales bacterium]
MNSIGNNFGNPSVQQFYKNSNQVRVPENTLPLLNQEKTRVNVPEPGVLTGTISTRKGCYEVRQTYTSDVGNTIKGWDNGNLTTGEKDIGSIASRKDAYGLIHRGLNTQTIQKDDDGGILYSVGNGTSVENPHTSDQASLVGEQTQKYRPDGTLNAELSSLAYKDTSENVEALQLSGKAYDPQGRETFRGMEVKMRQGKVQVETGFERDSAYATNSWLDDKPSETTDRVSGKVSTDGMIDVSAHQSVTTKYAPNGNVASQRQNLGYVRDGITGKLTWIEPEALK